MVIFKPSILKNFDNIKKRSLLTTIFKQIMEGIRLCPSIDEVFFENIEENKKYFKPLAAIDLSLLDPKMEGQVYIVYFMDDMEGEDPYNCYDENCDLGMVTFDIINGKYKFNGDYRYFLIDEEDSEFVEIGDKSYAEFLEKLEKEDLHPFDFLENFNKEPFWLQREEVPLNSRGEPMKFICQISPYKIINDYNSSEIYLFYDHDDKKAVQVTQVD